MLYKPKLLLISNFLGAGINLQITNLAYKSNIKVVSLVSEGNFDIEYLDQGLFGVSKNKVLNLDKYLLWSERTRKLAIKKYPQFKDKIFTSGATGFDRYKLLKFVNKQDF